MTVLSSKQVLEDKKTRDPNAITSLTLTHKALSDVSCLSEFKNLERLDLGFNNLSSLEGLKSCVNLKWLSVVQNKLESLKGIEGLTKLTVLNAGKNKLSSMDEVKSIVSLRALILNDNEIVSICGLDQMKELNTLVLSRNPIREIGESLFKVKSITKLSLSNCRLETIGHSLKSCTELKELRLAHNEITALPVELARNTKILSLDLGNNVIMSWSDLKVLSLLINLRNLNLQGNPISERDKLVKKIKKLVPNLQIFNAKPIDKTMKTEKGDTVYGAGFASANVDDKLVSQKRDQMDQIKSNKDLKYHIVNQSKNMHHDSATNLGQEMELKLKKQKRKKPVAEEIEEANTIIEKKEKKKTKQRQESDYDGSKNEETQDRARKEMKHKKRKINAVLAAASGHKEGGILNVEESKKKSKSKRNEVSIIDDSEIPLMDLFVADNDESAEDIVERTERKLHDMNGGAVVTFSKKRKKSKSHGAGPALPLSLVAEVGLGGPSTWDE